MTANPSLKIFTFFIALISPLLCCAQDPTLTLREARLLKNALLEFDQQFERTGDIEPFLQTMSGNRWFEHQCNKLARMDVSLIPADKNILHANPALTRRISIAMFNFTYLLQLQFASQPESAAEGKDFRFLLPDEVKVIFGQTVYGRALLKQFADEVAEEEDLELKTESEVLAVVHSFEQAIALLRQYQNSISVEQRAARNIRMQQLISEMSDAGKIHFCNPDCGDLPQCTRTIVINHGVFQLTFVAVDEQLRLELIATRLGE